MSTIRLTGVFDWYSEQGYGVIRGEDGNDYFAHQSGYDEALRPRKGLRVSFLARPRSRGKSGMEAYEVEAVATPNVTLKPRPVPAPVSEADDLPTEEKFRLPTMKFVGPSRQEPSDALRDATKEVLRLQRERMQGVRPIETETMPPGTRVHHIQRGIGTVVLAAPQTISVRFDATPHAVYDLPRFEVQPAIEESQRPAGQRVDDSRRIETTVVASASASTHIRDFIREMHREVQQTLLEDDLEIDDVYFYEEPRPALSEPQPLAIDKRVADAFRSTSAIHTFYSHQVQARQALLSGKHVLISTPTASGKTEAYNPTVLETLLREPAATALYIFPLVALGNDQEERLEKLNQALPLQDRLLIGISNSSVGKDAKSQMFRQDNRILVTTPESLHYLFLPKPYPNWRRFFRNLRFVVLDEAHIYRGVLGANMANIVRRLLIRCRREGNPRFPQLIVSSATVANPEKLVHQLTGLPAEDFAIIKESGAPTPARHFLATRSDIHELETVCADLLQATTIDSKKSNTRPVRTIAFLRSIGEVKRATERLRQQLRRNGMEHLCSQVEAYYSEKADKNDILHYLRDGNIRCLFTTTALMAGIDIGGLDVAIVKGFPGMVMDARQMFGRAGRVGEGAVIFIANRADPFDQFYFERSKLLRIGATEDVITNPENAQLLPPHLLCSAQAPGASEYDAEGPLPGEWSHLFGEVGQRTLDFLVRQGTLRIQQGRYWLDDGSPHGEAPLNNIRSMESEMYSLVQEDDRENIIERKRKATAFRDAHPEAIVWCNGEKYRVMSLDRQNYQIICRAEGQSNLRTQGIEQREVQILTRDLFSTPGDSSSLEGATVVGGDVELKTSVLKYLVYQSQTVMQCRNRRCRRETPNLEIRRCPACNSPVRAKQIEKVIEDKPIPQDPPLVSTLKTRACWLNIPQKIQRSFESEFWPRWQMGDDNESDRQVVIAPSFDFAVHSLEHLILKAFPDRIRCDRDEVGGIYLHNTEGLAARIFIYDNFPGGLGYADSFFFTPHPVLEEALQKVETCTCDDDAGCPVCLAHFGCHCFNTLLSKLAGRYLLRLILGYDTQPVIDDLRSYATVCIAPGKQVHEPPKQGAQSVLVDDEMWAYLDDRDVM